MKKAWLVAQWEFRNTVLRRAYIFAVLAMPLLFLTAGSISALTVPRSIAAAGNPTAIIDRAGIVDLSYAAEQTAQREQLRLPSAEGPPSPNGPVPFVPTTLVKYEDEHQALADLAARKLAAVYVIEADYLTTGNIVTYSADLNVFNQASATNRQNQVADAIRASLLRGKLPEGEIARAFAPALRLKRMVVDREGHIEDGSGAFGFARVGSSLGVFLLFTMALFFSSGFLQQATIMDRQNRVFEILLSSIDPDALILGKIVGLGGAGLLQVGIYLALAFVASSTFLPLLQLSYARLALSMVFFVIGYLLFASFMAAIGMISRNAQDSAQMSAWWTIAASAPLFVFPAIAGSPNGWLARGMSFFPLTSPVTMLLRLSTSNEVPLVDVALSILIGSVSVYAALRATVKIFRAATLMYGKRPTLPEFVHWLRAA